MCCGEVACSTYCCVTKGRRAEREGGGVGARGQREIVTEVKDIFSGLKNLNAVRIYRLSADSSCYAAGKVRV